MRTRAAVADVAPAAALSLAAGVELALADPSAATVAGTAAACGALVLRRAAPVAVLLVVVVAVMLGGDWGEEQNAPVFVAVLAAYSLGAHASVRRAVGGLAVVSALMMALDLAGGGHLSDGYFAALMLGMPWAFGRVVRLYRERALRLQALAAQLARERERSAGLARARERRRLAGEVHRAVAAAIGGVVEPLARAERLGEEEARSALAAAQRTGRAAVAELQGVLGALRTRPPPSPEPVAAPVRPRGWWPAWADPALAVALVILSAVTALASDRYAGVRWPAAGLALAGLAVAVRREHPLGALAVAVAAGAAESALIGDTFELPAALVAQLLALYSLAAQARARLAALGFAAAVAAATLLPLLQGRLDGADFSVIALFFSVPWLAGVAARRLHRQARELRVLTARLAAERDAVARLAVAEERTRVARDLHDAVAHSLSVMVLQAGAAEQVIQQAPDDARGAIRAAADQGRRALGELQVLLGVLDDRQPDAGVADLERLVGEVRRAGLPAQLCLRGQRSAVPAGVGAALYRIAQEALTNTVKHAGVVLTTVTLEYGSDSVAIEIDNVGGGAEPVPSVGGHGLLGMHERVAAHGGTLHAAPRRTGGFAVRAEFPLGRVDGPALSCVGSN